jgi:hypothetical protein
MKYVVTWFDGAFQKMEFKFEDDMMSFIKHLYTHDYNKDISIQDNVDDIDDTEYSYRIHFC